MSSTKKRVFVVFVFCCFMKLNALILVNPLTTNRTSAQQELPILEIGMSADC